jgi:hypothetical protein
MATACQAGIFISDIGDICPPFRGTQNLVKVCRIKMSRSQFMGQGHRHYWSKVSRREHHPPTQLQANHHLIQYKLGRIGFEKKVGVIFKIFVLMSKKKHLDAHANASESKEGQLR